MSKEFPPKQKRVEVAQRTGFTSLSTDFHAMCKAHPSRIGIFAEGDSWFAYPRKWIAFGADINIVHYISEHIQNTDTSSLLQLASSGDEAVDMTSEKQVKQL